MAALKVLICSMLVMTTVVAGNQTRCDCRQEIEALSTRLLNLEKQLAANSLNGQWTGWNRWSSCSATCGHSATKTRDRTCTNPAPAHGGATCHGNGQETSQCTGLPTCPVDGHWSAWVSWSACTATCGNSAIKTRDRTCTNPPPAHSGATCHGDAQETSQCTGLTPCPVVNGSWGPWIDIPPCRGNQGDTFGTLHRHRLCNNPTPSGGGHTCDGSDKRDHWCQL